MKKSIIIIIIIVFIVSVLSCDNDISHNDNTWEMDYSESLINSFAENVCQIEIKNKDFTNLQIENGGKIVSSTRRKSVIVRIMPNTVIEVKKMQTSYATMGFTTMYPADGIVVNTYRSWDWKKNEDIFLQAGQNDNYMILTYYDKIYDVPASEIEESIRIYYSSMQYGLVDYLMHADEHMINLLKYRPVGQLSKPYMAITCDDGNSALATYTIPHMKEWKSLYGQNIPITFALFDLCDVMKDETYKELVIDACENYGCSIAIHGTVGYDKYPTRRSLMEYIKAQDDYLYSETGIKPSSVIYPEHYYNDEIQTICGSLYNVCGSGGADHHLTYEDESGHPFYNGPKSNCYEIYRLAIHDATIQSLEDVEAIVDWACEHNYIICPYFHDADLIGPNKDYLRSVLDRFVSYGIQKGIEFINLGDIPDVL